MLLKPKDTKKKSYSIRTLDEAFSKFIRFRDTIESDGGGRFGACRSCGDLKSYADLDCGHYIGREHFAVRWDECNAAAQCQYCNRFQEGNKGLLRETLRDLYGEDKIRLIESLKRKGRKPVGFETIEVLKGIREKHSKLIQSREG